MVEKKVFSWFVLFVSIANAIFLVWFFTRVKNMEERLDRLYSLVYSGNEEVGKQKSDPIEKPKDTNFKEINFAKRIAVLERKVEDIQKTLKKIPIRSDRMKNILSNMGPDLKEIFVETLKVNGFSKDEISLIADAYEELYSEYKESAVKFMKREITWDEYKESVKEIYRNFFSQVEDQLSPKKLNKLKVLVLPNPSVRKKILEDD